MTRVGLFVMVVCALAGCGTTQQSFVAAEAPTPTSVAQESTSEPTPTPTEAPAATPTATLTPSGPTPTPTATAIPLPTATPTPEPFDPRDYPDRVWERRMDLAFAPYDCPPAEPITIPAGHYMGPLIDTHLHMPVLPDYPPGFGPGEREMEGFAEWFEYWDNMDEGPDDGPDDGGPDDEGPDDGGPDDEGPDHDGPMFEGQRPLGGQDQPVAGVNVTIPELACVLETEGTIASVAFFSVYDQNTEWMTEMARRSVDEYGSLFSPFLMSPNDDQSVSMRPPTLGVEYVSEFIDAAPGFWEGFGELGLYEIEGRLASYFPPDSDLIMEIYPVADANNLIVYLHPGDGHALGLARALIAFPEVDFIVHGDQISPYILNLMDNHENIYFTVNDLFGDQFLLGEGNTVETFLAKTDNFGPLLEKDWQDWKGWIRRHPDRFMWGTDRGGNITWGYDLQVGLRMVEYVRAFIGGLHPDTQEAFAYKNAERIIAKAGLD